MSQRITWFNEFIKRQESEKRPSHWTDIANPWTIFFMCQLLLFQSMKRKISHIDPSICEWMLDNVETNGWQRLSHIDVLLLCRISTTLPKREHRVSTLYTFHWNVRWLLIFFFFTCMCVFGFFICVLFLCVRFSHSMPTRQTDHCNLFIVPIRFLVLLCDYVVLFCVCVFRSASIL